MPREWLLSCSHTIPMLQHEHPGEPPTRPRMCSTCDRLRDVQAPAGAAELVCAQCGRVSVDGRGFRADVVPDYADEGEQRDAPELLAWCNECWSREFGE